ncbi:NADH-quinone oxidoreductase subunit G [Deinococcus metalli]|uniref:NADH-quinone oxidoreductase n=1 Tax=Deinococcus metalli TaxID=1141878 RepID=A0A7W8KFR4_9DEIO|nr:NADH-quinone oxidoreductase subunit NuoG [Deinococcus metalli]MBB5376918.1 NADH-quinone oxidoreductase subunit G [Deinococcus metalli]GHF46305.1 NADH-quinone oxidoreductase [Deinococcus metalli]
MKVVVDGVELDLPAGTSAIDAVFQSGGDVPYFCAHKYLSPVGACRMCLVESGSPRKNPDGTFVMEGEGDAATPKIFWFPKPMASCTMQATEGMHIRSAKTSPVVAKAQAGMMEFTLLNHPLDCPTCDKGGACELQDRAFEYGYGASRFGFDRRHADKHYPLSEYVILDQERCIHCKRCVRYFEEVPGQEVLDFIERGGHTFIDTEEGGLPTGFQGNITDICPVGALLDNVARFRGRNWEYDHTPTTCTLCPVGCSITVDARNGRLERIVAGENRDVNEAWICDAGRFGHSFASADRLTVPLVRGEDGQLHAATWDDAINAINRGLAGQNMDDLALYIGSDSTLEEGLALESLAEQTGTKHVDHWPRYEVSLTAPAATLTDVATADLVVVIGADLGEEAPVLELRILEMLRGGILPAEFDHGTAIADLRLIERPVRKLEKLIVIGQESRLWTHAGTRIPANGMSGVTRLATPDTDDLRAALKALEAAEKPVIVLGADALNGASGSFASAVAGLAARTGAKVMAIPAGPNSRGLAALNLVPRAGGLGYAQLAQAPAAFISRLDPGVTARGFTVVHDTHLTATAQRADVVLPALTNYEKRGTTVNLEGRLLSLSQAALSSGEAADLIRTLGALAEALGVRTKVRGLKSAQALAAARFGLKLDSVPERGVIHPLPSAPTAPTALTHTPRLWTERMQVRRDDVERAEHINSLGGMTLPMLSIQPGGDD